MGESLRRGLGRWLAALALALLPLLAFAADRLPSFEELKAGHPSAYAYLLDRDGGELARVRLDPNRERLAWMPLSSLGQPMKDALLAAEDRRFFQHSGVDWRAFAAAVWQNLWYDHTRGASTLSMQLAGLLDPNLRPRRTEGGRRTLVQKWDQAWAATELERTWSKSQILEAYLNLAPLRGQLEGVPAAAHVLFGKTPLALDHAEAALIAVLLRGPNAPAGRVGKRACTLLASMHESSACARAQGLAAHLDQRAEAHGQASAHALAAHLALRRGEAVHTTLSLPWQEHAQAALPGAGGGAAIAVVDNASGELLAWAMDPPGGQLFAAHPATEALRWLQLGENLGEGAIGLASLQDVAPGGSVEPLWISVHQALQAMRSASLPEAWLARLPHERQDRILQLLASASAPGAGRARLGPDAELDLPAMASLVRALAAGGAWQGPLLIPGAEAANARACPEEGAFLLGQVLRERGGRTGDLAAVSIPAEGGRWELAFDRRVSAAAWVGGGAPEHEWLPGVLRGAPQAQPLGPPRPPAGVVSSWVAFVPPVEPARREWFLRGRESAVVRAPGVVPRIRWPANGTLVDARDLGGAPVVFSAEGGSGELRWRLDGSLLGSGRLIAWQPHAGLYLLELLGPGGEVLDQSNFAVRGPLQDPQQEPGEQGPE